MMEQFTYFYKSDSPFSQWYPADFEIEGVRFNSAEQYMMYGKAQLFGDQETARSILAAKTPREQKALGRKVRNFEQGLWEEHCREIVYRGNEAKFLQHPALLEALKKTQGTTLVEASPTDRIWGVGLAEGDHRITRRATWRGTNWLGEILTRLREDLLFEPPTDNWG